MRSCSKIILLFPSSTPFTLRSIVGRGFSPRRHLVITFVPNVCEWRAPLKPLTAFLATVDCLGRVKGGVMGGCVESRKAREKKIKYPPKLVPIWGNRLPGPLVGGRAEAQASPLSAWEECTKVGSGQKIIIIVIIIIIIEKKNPPNNNNNPEGLSPTAPVY